MNIKSKLASSVSKALGRVCRVAKSGGTTFPGKIAFKLCPDALREIAKCYKTIMVTGTNGKTTTTLMIGQMLKENGIRYITNKSGANLIGGIATTFFNSTDSFENSPAQIALIEVDEATFHIINNYMEPEILIVTNFFRDQLDRYGELYTTINNIKLGIQKFKNTKLILNADDSLCASLGVGSDKEVLYFGMGPDSYNNIEKPVYTDAMYCVYCKSKYTYSNYIYGHLGGFRCPKCGYMRPHPSITCSKIDELNSSYSMVQLSVDVSINNHKERGLYEARINMPGLYNIYNSMAALSCGILLELPVKKSLNRMSNLEAGFGRTEIIQAGEKKIKLILVKNPSSFNQAINFLILEKKIQAVFIVNDKLADGTDISWLWDVDFEKLQQKPEKINKFYVYGIRAEDMALRLKYADIDMDRVSMVKDYREVILKGLEETPENGSFYILATYTAMLGIRKHLKEMFGLKEFWE